MIKQLLLLLTVAKSQILFKTLGIFFLALVTFLLWEVSAFVLSNPVNRNANYVPVDARWTVRMDGNAFFKESFSEAFLSSEENEIVDLIQEIVENRTKSKESVDLGVDFLSDVYASSIMRDDKQLLVLMFNLRNAKKFENILNTIEMGAIAYSQDRKVGILVLPALKKNGFSQSRLSQIAQEVAEKKSATDAHEVPNDLLSSFWINTKEFQGELHVAAVGNDLNFTGDLRVELPKQKKNRQLAPNGLHLTHASLTGALKDTLSAMLTEFMPSLPSGITSVSMNYRGAEIISDGNMFILPDIDVLLGYDKEVDIEAFLAQHAESQAISNLTKTTFNCEGKTFFFEQVNPRMIYIGRQKLTYASTNHFLLLAGKPDALLTIHGDNSYLRFARLMPTFAASENLVHAMEEIHLSISEPQKGKSVISGNVKFSENATPIGALLEFLVRTEVVK